MAGRFTTPFGNKLSPRRYKKAWFSGRFYKSKSPFATFAKQNMILLRTLVNEQATKFGIQSAMEIGPGDNPVLLGSVIPHVSVIEKSKKLSKAIQKKAQEWDYNVAVHNADFQKMPWKNHDLVILNEILCMVRPKDRIKQLMRIMKHSKHILIVERSGMPIPKLEPLLVTQQEVEAMANLMQANKWNVEIRKVISDDYRHYTLIIGRKM